MTEKRLTAYEAYTLVSKISLFQAAHLICARAHDGLIVAQAQTLVWGDDRENDIQIPRLFWQARGGAGLKQNWEAGDFETWIDNRIHCRAYGVTFLEAEIRAMLPAGGDAPIAQPVVADEAGSDGYLSSSDAAGQVEGALGVSREGAGDLIKRYCAADLVRSRCEKISVTIKDRYGTSEEEGGATDLDHGTWEHLSFVWGGIEDWAGGRFVGRIADGGDERKVRLIGVQFSASDIAALITAEDAKASPPPAPTAAPAPEAPTGGRPLAAFWDDLWAEIGRALYDGDLQPKRQADIERVMLAFVEDRGIDVAVSTIRPRARKLWQALSKEDKN